MQAPLANTASFVNDLQTYWGAKNHSKKEIIEAARDLARLNASYELKIKENSELKNEINRLERILQLPVLPSYHFEIARISERDINSWWQQMTIRKGRVHGIKKGAAVIYSGGVVGRIKEVYTYTSIVELVTSHNFRIAAHIENDNRPVRYQGLMPKTLSHPIGEARDIPTDLNTVNSPGLRLVTTHLSGNFPEGLTIGYIYNLEPDSDGLFQSAEVVLDKKLLELQEVVVLLPFDSDNHHAF